jgi:hypothetical protein
MALIILIKKKIRLLATIVLIINFASCQNQKKQSNLETVKIFKNYLNLEGHTFFKVTETDSGKILFKPCDASIEKYKFYRDSLYHNWGQEFDIVKKISFKKNKNIYSIKEFNTNTNENNIFQIEKSSEAYYLKINDEIFIDSLQSKKIRLIEQPLKDCGDDDKKSSSNLNGVWRVDCANTLTVLDISNSDAYLSLFSNTIFINAKIESVPNNNTYLLKFLNQENNYVSDENKLDVENISKEKSIGKLEIKDNKLILYWYGLYNQKTEKLNFVEDFVMTKENSGKNTMVLTKCD